MWIVAIFMMIPLSPFRVVILILFGLCREHLEERLHGKLVRRMEQIEALPTFQQRALQRVFAEVFG